MSAPTGNTFAKGNKGGGRKSAYLERLDADYFWSLWEGKVKKEKVQKRITLGKHGVRDLFALKVLEGNERMLTKLVDKLYPNVAPFDIQSFLEENEIQNRPPIFSEIVFRDFSKKDEEEELAQIKSL